MNFSKHSLDASDDSTLPVFSFYFAMTSQIDQGIIILDQTGFGTVRKSQ
jgi:hypothetical protein